MSPPDPRWSPRATLLFSVLASATLWALIVFGAFTAANAQAVQQSGPIVPFHVPTWTANGVQADGGSALKPGVGLISMFNGPNCPLTLSSQTGPGATVAPIGQFSVCQTQTTTTLKIQGLNGAAAPNLVVNIGGVNYPFPGSGSGNVVGPISSTVGQNACFNNIFGTLLTGCSGGVTQITRAQISTVTLGANATITTIGYRTAGDLGAGAVYTSVGATSTGIGAIQDQGGTWFNLVLANSVNVGWFGSYGDAGSHLVSSGDLAANTWFRGCYTAGVTTWDTVAFTEAIDAAHANVHSTPCVGGISHVSWNSVAGGASNALTWAAAPSGNYGINQQLLDVAAHIVINASPQGCLNWIGSSATAMLKTNSVAYASINDICLSTSAFAATPYSGAAIWVMDHASAPGGLSTQQIIVKNGIFFTSNAFNNVALIAINPVGGGAAQGSTIKFIQSEFLCGSGMESAVQINGDNALDISFDSGDFEGCAVHTIENFGGSVVINNPTTENQNLSGFFTSPQSSQFTEGGPQGSAADYYGQGVTSGISTINWNRQEGDISAFCMSQCQITGPGFVLGTSSAGGWAASVTAQTGSALHDVTAPGRTFLLVRDTTDTVGTNGPLFWRTIGAGSTVCTINDPGASFSVNAFQNYGFRARFTGGFTYNVGPIASNDATHVNLLAHFTGAISGTTLTVSGTDGYVVANGFNPVVGSGVTAGTIITAQLTGSPGSNGTYSVNNSQSVGSEAMTSGTCLPSVPTDEYHIEGMTGAVPPTWSAATHSKFYVGVQDSGGSAGFGFSTVANSTTVTLGNNVSAPSTGQWLCIPGGTFIGPNILQSPGIFCTTLTYSGGSTATMDQPASYTMNGVSGYIGDGITDGTQGLVWMDLDFDVLHNVPVQGPYVAWLYGRMSGANAYSVAPGRPDWNRGQTGSLAAAPLYGGWDGYHDRTMANNNCPTLAGTTALPAGAGNDFRCSITQATTFTPPADVAGKAADLSVTLVSDGTARVVTWGTGFAAGLPTFTTSGSAGAETTFRFVLDGNQKWNPVANANGIGVFQVGKLTGANFNSTADQAISLTGPGTFLISNIVITNASTSLTTAQGGFYSAASKTGIFMSSTTTPYTYLTSAGLVQNYAGGNAAPAQTIQCTNTCTIYLSLTTPQGGAATADVRIYGMPMQ